VITSKGKSFRYESRYHRTLERLWDYTTREIVFIGERDFVVESRERFMESTFSFVEQLGLSGHTEVANDPFFAIPNIAAKVLNQKMFELKYELRLPVDSDRTIAVASFNFHDQFFGQQFEIQNSASGWVSTGCVGFGLERFTYAFLCRHGIDPQHWPPIPRGG
jgi:seryl-tRNA synthetase